MNLQAQLPPPVYNLIMVIDNTHFVHGHLIDRVRKDYLYAKGFYLRPRAIRDYLAGEIRRFITQGRVIEVMPYRFAVERDRIRKELEDLKSLDAWDHIRVWRIVANHYLEQLQDEIDEAMLIVDDSEEAESLVGSEVSTGNSEEEPPSEFESPQQRDFRADEITGVQISADGKRLWVCVDGACILRVRSPKIELTDLRN